MLVDVGGEVVAGEGAVAHGGDMSRTGTVGVVEIAKFEGRSRGAELEDDGFPTRIVVDQFIVKDSGGWITRLVGDLHGMSLVLLGVAGYQLSA
jgi:hypothetical protein